MGIERLRILGWIELPIKRKKVTVRLKMIRFRRSIAA